MDYEGYTFVFLSKYKQEFPYKNDICIMIILFNHRKLFLKWM